MKLIQTLFLVPIKIYQYFISPLLGPRCRFTPTCSHYAEECLKKLPLHKALFKIAIRLSKCHPFHKGGHDPVFPDKKI